MKTIKKIYSAAYEHPALWCFSAGVIYSLAFLWEYLFAFSFIGLFLFFYRLIENGSVPHPFKRAMAFFMGCFPVLYSWLTELYPFEQFGFTPFQGICIVIIGIFGISAYHAAVMSLIFLISKLFPARKELLPPSLACLFVFGEWFLNVGDLNFSWGTLAMAQSAFKPLLQTASLFGGYFITFVVVACCGYLALFALHHDKRTLTASLCFILIPVAAGSVLLALPQSEEKEIKAAVIQGNTLSNDKWKDENLSAIIDKYIELTEEAAAEGAELIALPESAFPTYFSENGVIHDSLAQIAEKYGCIIYTGALINDGGKHNSIIAVKPDGSLTDYYTKRRLVPFGESMPLKPAVDFVFNVLGINFSRVPYVAGTDPAIIDAEGIKAGGLVCFDSIFPSLSRDSVNAGADLLILVTNDSWYKDSPAVYQHVRHAEVRAVETGRYIVRAANTGVSCFITPKGETYGMTSPLVEAISYGTVSTASSMTLYSYVGDIPLYLTFIYFAFCAIYKTILTIRRKKHGKNQII